VSPLGVCATATRLSISVAAAADRWAPIGVMREDGSYGGSGDRGVEQRRGWVAVLVEGLISHLTVYPDIDEARATAERLAESRIAGSRCTAATRIACFSR